jgi:hypothetical protein
VAAEVIAARLAPPLAWGALALSVVAFAWTIVLIAQVPSVAYIGSVWADVALSAAFVGTAALGAVIAQRQPRLSIGWIFCAIGAPMVLTLALVRYGMNGLALDGRTDLGLMWVAQLMWIPSITLLATALPLLFPDGAPPSPRWRPVARLIPVVIVFLVAGYALRPGPFQEPFESIASPLWPGIAAPTWYTLVLALVQIPYAVVCFAGLYARFRRSHGVERQQIKWFLLGVTLMVVFLVTATLAEVTFGYQAARELSGIGAAVALAAPAVTAAIGILRYRLFDIDVLIRRTLVYGATIGSIGAGFVAAALILQAILRPVTGGSDVAIASSTLLTVAAFQPLRLRIQAEIDRRFYRSRYDASRTLDAFTARMRDQVDIDAVRGEVLDVVRTTVRPAHASVWLREAER